MTKNQGITLKKIVSRLAAVLAMVAALFPLAMPAAEAFTLPNWLPLRFSVALADDTQDQAPAFVLPGQDQDTDQTVSSKPQKSADKAKAAYTVYVTAYTSSIEECDSSPFTTADGSDTRYLYGDPTDKQNLIDVTHLPSGQKVRVDGIIAWNYATPDAKYRVPFGTKVRLPKLFGDMIFEVHDRLNDRFHDSHIDVWVADRKMENLVTTKNATMEIVEWGDGKAQWNQKPQVAQK
ncbi:MAG TPA: hypothetical protein VFQ60_01600 [Patescibacteria group bacterium]|nr:hypothetical protein [Patescibacteria group bacterium]